MNIKEYYSLDSVILHGKKDCGDRNTVTNQSALS